MDRHLVEYKLANGKIIAVEVETLESEYERISNSGGTERAIKKFEQAIDDIAPATEAVLKMLKNLGVVEGQLEVGLKFSAKAGVVLASADSEATFKITMKWKPE
ncbi:MAG: hypothetical protein K2Q45_07535 [Nitrosomonas sp.]|nr:hypothetical protein [Nitrosomonas sp.]